MTCVGVLGGQLIIPPISSEAWKQRKERGISADFFLVKAQWGRWLQTWPRGLINTAPLLPN